MKKKRLILIGFIILIFLIYIKGDKLIDIIGMDVRGLRDLKLVDSIDLEEYENIKMYSDRMFVWNDNDIIMIHKNKKTGKNSSINLSSLGITDKKLLFGESQIYIIDDFYNIIKVVDLNGKEKETYFLENPIFNVVEEEGNVIVHYKKGNFETIEIYDLDFNKIKAHSVEKRNILTYNLNKKNNDYFFSVLKITKDDIASKGELYDIKGNLKWSIEFPNEVIMKSRLVSDGIVIQTDEYIHLITDGKISWSKKINSIDKIDIYEEKIYILYQNTIEIVDFTGKTISKLALEKNYNKMTRINDKMLILYGGRNILGILDGDKALEYINDDLILSIDSNDDYIGVKSKNNLKLYKIVIKK